MKTIGNGFNYYLDGKQLKDFDEFERKIKNIEVKIEVENLEIKAKTVENGTK